jgi:curved DNA-binding protein CbpA
MKTHPDVCKDKNAKEKFVRIKDAYDILSNPIARSRHDALFGTLTGNNVPGMSIFFSFTMTE